MKTRPVEFFDSEIEPRPLCRNCEYADFGGLDVKGNPLQDHGDCSNSNSPYFTTGGTNSCSHFFPCSTRWPDADHD